MYQQSIISLFFNLITNLLDNVFIQNKVVIVLLFVSIIFDTPPCYRLLEVCFFFLVRSYEHGGKANA